MSQPLDDVLVIEVGDGVAVGCATKQFSDFGADVVKVERPGGGELRRLPPFPGDRPDVDAGGFHLTLDTGKRSLALGVDTPSGREVLQRLSAKADVVVIELPPTLALSVRAAAIEAAEPPDTVVITPHGLDGPYSDRLANDLSIYAWSTRMHAVRLPDEPPLRLAPHVASMQVGLTAAALAASLVWSRRGGAERRDAEVAGVEAHAGNVDTWFTAWSMSGGTFRRPAAPTSRYHFPCKDGYVQVVTGDPPFFERLCEVIGRPEWAVDPRFSDREAREQHYGEFLAGLLPWLANRDRYEVFHAMQAKGVACAPLLDVSEAMTDAQAIARRSFVEVEQPVAGRMTIPGAPFRLGGIEGDDWQARPAPRLGEHTTEILDELGYTRDEQIALFRAGVTG